MKVSWLLVDLNSFFASCEQQDDPSLRGKPVAVVPMMANNTSVLAASYEAKRFGIKTGTKVFEAKKMCPDIQFIATGHRRYVEYHHKIIEAVHKVCPVKKVLSIDEMVCQLIGREQDLANALKIGKDIKQIILDEVGSELKSSVGLGPNITIAKIASDLQKPDGLIAIPKEQIIEKIGHLDVQCISGVGYNMKKNLNAKGFFTVSDLLKVSPQELKKAWGSIVGLRLAEELRGQSIIRKENDIKAFSHEHVLPPHLRTLKGAFQIVQKLLFKGCFRLRTEKRKAQGLTISIRFLDGNSFERSIEFQRSDDTFMMMNLIKQSFPRHIASKPIKVGIVLNNLTVVGDGQLSFFDDNKNVEINKAIDVINKKFGPNTIVTAGCLDVLDEAKARVSFGHIPDLGQDYE